MATITESITNDIVATKTKKLYPIRSVEIPKIPKEEEEQEQEQAEDKKGKQEKVSVSTSTLPADIDIPLPPPTTAPTEVLSIDRDTPDHHVPRDPRLIRLTGVHPFNVEAPLTDLFNEGRLFPDLIVWGFR